MALVHVGSNTHYSIILAGLFDKVRSGASYSLDPAALDQHPKSVFLAT